ncbi:pentatricopeptide repeat-containing protein [Corchorus olitorius]|uniref:Pentatricopeptide repeat-containing protein n=1 Tax=Corchorus olitorius TaxID=93759 RepID=A0A1R3KYU6_9ROSI|nr:pentatricopeptide repeat-containing protein [Corchorus olitorius]
MFEILLCGMRGVMIRHLMYVYVECAMIDMFAKCGSLSQARQIFEGIENCLYHVIVGLFLKMKDAEIRTNAIVAASVVPGLAKLTLLKQGKEMHGYILKQGFESDIAVGTRKCTD